GCTEKTVDVFFESAYFDPIRTAESGRRLNVMSDARYRFERGVDPAMVRGGMEIATRLILEICGGEASDLVIAGDEPAWQRTVAFRPDRLRTLGGVTLSADTAKAILALLGFSVEDTGTAWQVSVPSWRGDIVGEADLVEEILRVNGYDNIPAVSLPRIDSVPQPALDSLQVRRKTARRALAARGLYEAVTYSFMSSNAVGLFGGAADAMHLANPISSDLDVMRPSILPNLIAAAGRNADRGYGDGALFEVGPQYAGAAPEDQRMVAAGIRAGQTGPRHWANPPRPCDVYDAKADALAVLDVLGAPVANVQIAASAPGWYHPGRSGALTLGPKTVLAYFGEIHPRVLMAMGVKGPVAGFEILLDHLPLPKVRKGPARPALELSAFQPVERDFAFVVDEHVEAAALMRAAAAADKALIVCVDVFDVFAGGNIGAGKKSIALSVTLQPRDKTLTEAEIDAVAGRIIGGVGKATGAVLRT
ncbi:MAG: phenylalanine--tRNA ligase subunit beta, partial [Amphiplicatus sp.]